MFEAFASRVSGFVARHDLLVIALLVLLTVGVGAGLPQLDMEDQTAIDDEVFTATDVGEGLEYMTDNYDAGNDETARSSVYVRPEKGNALSKESLVGALAYQEAVLADSTVERELVEDSVSGPPTLVGTHLAGDNATIAEQKAAIQNASATDLEAAITTIFSDPDLARQYLPRSYEPGTAEAESLRMFFEFEQAAVTQQQEPLPDEGAQQTLYDEADDREAIFTMGTVAQAKWDTAQIQDVFMLIVPPALLLVLVVLAFAYRDIVDVLLGFVGVSVSVVWFFGILGWLGIPAGFASIVGPVLIVALSIDFGLHVFMRYREERASSDVSEQAIRHAMGRSTGSVLVAFLLVALTAAVGFLANVTSPIGFIRAFGVVITLGVLSAVLIFVTLVPAMKIRIDSMLEGFGVDRQKTALGTGGLLKPFLSTGVTIARHGALAVIVISVIAGAVGMLAYTEIERQGFQEDFVDEGDWQTEIPQPLGWDAHETDYRQNLDYVQSNYQDSDERNQATTMLIRGNMTDVQTLERIHAGETAASESDLTFEQGDEVPTQSPISMLRTAAVENEEFAVMLVSVAQENEPFADLLADLAAEHDQFATALADAREQRAAQSRDEGGAAGGNEQLADQGGAPADLTAVYDTLYEIAPEKTAQVLERTDGEYRSMRLIVPVEQGLDVNDQGEEMHRIADETEGDSELDVVPIGFATVSNAGLGEIADSILLTMLLAFGGVAVVLAASYRLERGYATLGAVTVVPILLVVGFVFGGMLLFDIPLTFITAFLVSITIGLGIDYNIHISDRFAQELDAGAEPVDALETTVTGTGGALLGSALTSGAAFAMLIFHPSPVFQSFGFIVVIALLLSFVVSVLVFPSMLLSWARWRLA